MKNLFYILFLFVGYFLGSAQIREPLVINYLQKNNLIREPQSDSKIIVSKQKEPVKQEHKSQNQIIAKKTRPIIKYYFNNKSNYNFRIKGLVGYGLTGNYSIIDSNSSVNFNQDKGLIYGVGVDYRFNDRQSIGIQYLSNESVLSSFGYDF